MKKFPGLCFFFFVLLLVFLSACNADTRKNGDNESVLRIVTDVPVSANAEGNDYLSGEIVRLLQEFQKQHPDVQVKIENMSSWELDERNILFTRLRSEIMAGEGPDIFLFQDWQTYSVTDENGYSHLEAYGSLLQDVNSAMRNNIFYDLSDLYDADTELGKEALQQDVMEAGVLNGARYVLPLRYDMPVYVTTQEGLEKIGKDEDWLRNTTVQEKMEEAIAAHDPILAGCSVANQWYDGYYLTYLPDCIDYDTGNFKISEEEFGYLWKLATLAEGICGNREFNWIPNLDGYYKKNNTKWTMNTRTFPVVQCNLQEAISVIGTCAYQDIETIIAPVRAVDGSISAHVTFWGAINANSEKPELAYEFLRQFLSEDSQWERQRPYEGCVNGAIAHGWPVRCKGSVADMTQIATRCFSCAFTPTLSYRRDEFLSKVQLTDEDMPIFDIKIDHVRFPTTIEYTMFAQNLQGYSENTNHEVYRMIGYYLAEG